MKKFLIIVCCFVLVVTLSIFILFPLPGSPVVLMYHFIGTQDDALRSKNYVSVVSLEKQMSFLKRFGYRVISLDDYQEILSGKKKSKGREVVITFDDGNYSFKQFAVPVFEKFQYPVSVFAVTDNLKKGEHGSMTPSDFQELAKMPIVRIGSHTATHPFLSQLSNEDIRRELLNSKISLEKMFHVPIHYLAYPYGDFDLRVAKIAEDTGYLLAFTTSPKKLEDRKEGPYSITRTKVTRSSDNLFVFWIKVTGLYQFFKTLRS